MRSFFYTNVFLLLLPSSGVVQGEELKMWSDGPAVLDAPISVFARLSDYEGDPEDPLKWYWWDSSAYVNSKTLTTPGNVSLSNFTLTYDSQRFEASSFQMGLRVYQKDFLGIWILLVDSSVSYEITKDLNGQLSYPEGLISSQSPLNISLVLHDPHSALKNASLIEYFWSVNETNYGVTSEPFQVFTPTALGISHFKVIAVATFPDNHTKYGNFSADIIVRDPILFVNATGDLWIKHNQVLDLNVDCDGSGPWSYCWSVQDPSYNVTGNETCLKSTVLRESCAFEVYWYFRQAGSHKVLVIVNNGVSQIIKLYEVTVYKIKPQTPVSFIVVPIVSVIGIMFALIIALHLVVKFKRRLAIETADFDFSLQDDHNLEYRTFWERLRDSMLNAFGNASDDVSHISSSNSSSHGGSAKPPVGIHYGSIS